MGFWRRALLLDVDERLPATPVETRAESFSIGDPALAEFLGLQGQSLAGVDVTEKTSLGLTAVWRAVALISGTIAGLPLRSLRTLEDGSRERVSSFLDTPHGPDGMTQFEWVEQVLVHLLIHGNAYLQHVYNAAGALVALHPIVPTAVTVKPVKTVEELARFGDFRKYFTVALADGTERDLTPAELTHIPAMSNDGLRGMSPIEWHRQALGTGIAGDQAAARLFGSGLLLGGLVSGDEGLSQDDAAEALAQLKSKMAGSKHAGDIAFINAQLKFTSWTIPPVDAQFIESRAHQVEEVARIYGVPPHLLMQTEKQTSWGTGVAEQNRGLSRFTLMGWTTRIEQRLARLTTRPTTVEFDYSGLLQPAPEVEIPLLLQQIDAGLLTVNEARRIRNLPPLPDAELEPAPEPVA